ncbi:MULTISPECIES: PilW family protein [unclassified Pseudomonas]|uniref:PilW family protein n=1 Tax=unclassified Pseudomonas TaxID=196821 RepID=UPI000A1DD5A3|nr:MULTISPECIES: prepilin-type N-terminal cleavage/methylation domain-containing protein [unclassified Pseudomonas]
MRRKQGGFGLLEMTLALAIGLMVLAVAGQLFTSAHRTWQLQGTALRLQDDARLALLRMAQDIRMAGMFGCLRLGPGNFNDPVARQAFEQPLEIGPSSLSLIVAELPGHTGEPEWTLLTDCMESAHVHKGRIENPDTLMAIPISRHRYALKGTSLTFRRRYGDNSQTLVDHVRQMRVEHVHVPEGERVDLQLTLYEPTSQLEQLHELSVALRNPVSVP